ncbi:hypothetical protein ACUN29_41655 (plasmid) [Streptomyces sp. WC2508]|uniref:hypothetical protein n=1 Tax=Streptomyces sp. WC2508 TaxID=3461405 RepID=UPI004043D083
MNSNDPKPAPLSDVAQSPEATARYLADVQRVLLDIGRNLETLAMETRVHCRGTHLDGDRWYHARLRALPVEKALKDVLKHVNGLTEGLEKSAYKRNAFADEVKKLPGMRREKELERRRKKNPQLQAVSENSGQQGARASDMDYGNPTSIYDLDSRESA